ncbi:hypothetical protein BI347_09465 [Chromobacterium sphagni]|uniref:RNA polymerase subunit sigma-24 n=2 Tax=Chromobacterium sphagni TaxID=1903179 RepID=A0A1S1X2T9_9NEIS|nr:hypothetical protein BI347_09465 [Chromobacterium sphagni]
MHLPLFMQHRPRLLALGYRMLGSRAEAQDLAQEAWLRWSECDLEGIAAPGAYLTQLMARLCLDQIKSARRRREQYVGVWLPEPLADGDDCLAAGPEQLAERAQQLSYAYLLALQRLEPLERAAFLLREVFDVEYPQLAAILQRSQAACRQLASRARRRLQDGGQAVPARPPGDPQALAEAFVDALQGGDVDRLAGLLAMDVRYQADGGGKALALPAPLAGRRAVSRLLRGLWRRSERKGAAWCAQRLNGMPGVLVWEEERLLMSVALQCDAVGRVSGLYVMRNPDKLAHLTAGGCGQKRSNGCR